MPTPSRRSSQHGADVNARSNPADFPRFSFGDGIVALMMTLPRGHWTPLMYAARQGAVDAVRALVAARADLNLTDPGGHDRADAGDQQRALRRRDAARRAGADPNVADVTGMTALYAAVNMNTLGDLPGRPAPRPTGRVSALDVARTLLDARSQSERAAQQANPAAAALGRRRRARRRGHAVSPRGEDRRRGDDAAAARARRRSGADDQEPDDRRDVRGGTGVGRTRRLVSRCPTPTRSRRFSSASSRASTSTPSTATARRRCMSRPVNRASASSRRWSSAVRKVDDQGQAGAHAARRRPRHRRPRTAGRADGDRRGAAASCELDVAMALRRR